MSGHYNSYTQKTGDTHPTVNGHSKYSKKNSQFHQFLITLTFRIEHHRGVDAINAQSDNRVLFNYRKRSFLMNSV